MNIARQDAAMPLQARIVKNCVVAIYFQEFFQQHTHFMGCGSSLASMHNFT
jgi:hypothetical protein